MSRTYYLYRGSEGSESLRIWSLLQIRLDEQSECAARALSAKGVFSPLGRWVLSSASQPRTIIAGQFSYLASLERLLLCNLQIPHFFSFFLHI